MGFFRRRRDAGSAARLGSDLVDTRSKWERLPEDVQRTIAELAKEQIDSTVAISKSWPAAKIVDEGRNLRTAAILQFNTNPVAAYSSWFTGAWLESAFSTLDEAAYLQGTIEGVLTQSLRHLRIYWDPRNGVTQSLDED